MASCRLGQARRANRRSRFRAPGAGPPSAGRSAGRRRAAPAYRGGAAARAIAAVRPSSITRPPNSSVTSSQICATTPRSCVTKTTAVPCALLHVADEPQDLLLHRHVERRGRLVRDDQSSVRARRRPRSARAAACRRKAHADRLRSTRSGSRICTSSRSLSASARAASASSPRQSLRPSVSCASIRRAGIERGHRVLRNQRDALADEPAQRAASRIVRRSAPSNWILPPVTRTVRGRMPRIALRDRRLAGAALADEAARFAARATSSETSRRIGARSRSETALEADNGENRLAHRRITGSSARRRPSPSRLKASTVRNSAISGAASTHAP